MDGLVAFGLAVLIAAFFVVSCWVVPIIWTKRGLG